jgi:hypothetical protein
MGAEVDYQVAAPAEYGRPTCTERTIAHKRVRMEGWRQRRPGSEEDCSTIEGNYKTDLTLTGLIIEGLGDKDSVLAFHEHASPAFVGIYFTELNAVTTCCFR